jgi:hypothetical protein
MERFKKYSLEVSSMIDAALDRTDEIIHIHIHIPLLDEVRAMMNQTLMKRREGQ